MGRPPGANRQTGHATSKRAGTGNFACSEPAPPARPANGAGACWYGGISKENRRRSAKRLIAA